MRGWGEGDGGVGGEGWGVSPPDSRCLLRVKGLGGLDPPLIQTDAMVRHPLLSQPCGCHLDGA